MARSAFGGGGGRSAFGSGRPPTISPEIAEEYYAALLGRSNVPTETPKGLLDRLWDNPITDAFASLIPGAPQAKGLVSAGAGPVGQLASNLVDEGEDNPIYGPAAGGLNRIFDILSRGQYAASGAAEQLMAGREGGDTSIPGQLESIWRTGASIPAMALPEFLQEKITQSDADLSDVGAAAVRGLAGRDKTSFTQVLESQGVQNPVLQHGAGFGLDIALDPLTFLGVGKAKEASRIQKIRNALLNEPDAPAPSSVGTSLELRTRNLDDGTIDAQIVDADWLADHFGLPEAYQLKMPPGGVRSRFEVDPSGAIKEVKGVDRVIYNPDGTYSRKHFDYDPTWTMGREIEIPGKPGIRAIVPDLRDPIPTSEFYDPFRLFDEVKELGPSRLGPDDFSLGPIEVNRVPGTKKIEIRRKEDLARRLDEWAKMQKKPQRRLPRHKGEPNKRLIQMGPVGSTDMPIVRDAPIQAPPAAPAITRQAPEWVSPGAYRHIMAERPPKVPKALGAGRGPIAALPPGNTLGELVEGLGRTTQSTTRRGPRVAEPKRGGPLAKRPTTDRAREFTSSVQSPKGGALDTFKPTDDSTKFRFAEDFDPGSNRTGPVDPKTGKGEELFPKDERGYFSINVLGAPILKSYKAYEMGKKWFNPVLYNNAGEARMMYEMFSNNAVLPDGLDQVVRTKQSARLDEMDGRVNGVVQTLKHLDDDTRKKISFAIDEGENLGGLAAPDSLRQMGFDTLEDVRQWAKGLYENLDAAERAQGVSTGDRVPDYFYKVDKKGKPLNDKLSLQELVDAGEDVQTDILQSLIHRIARTESRLTRSDIWIDSANRFGISKSQVTPEFKQKFNLVEVPGFPDRLMPRQYVDALNHTDRIFTNDEYAAKMLQIYDTVLQEWKFLATAANPGHHIRNFWSDTFMNAQDGVLTGSPYKKAARVIGKTRGSKLADEGMAGTYNYVPGETVPRVFKDQEGTVTLGKSQAPLQDVWNGYIESGAKSSFQQTELHRTSERMAKTGWYSKSRKLGGDIARSREDYVRLAHFVDAMHKAGKKKGKLHDGENWTAAGREAIREAGEKVRKWNLDYGSLTPFERRYMKRLIPFYSFMRLNIPRQVEMLFAKPGFMALYPKGQNLFQGLAGTDDADDTLLPDWIRESAPFRLQMDKQEQKGALGWILNKFGVEPGQQALMPGTGFVPAGDLGLITDPLTKHNPVQETLSQVLQMTSPAVKAPVELGTNKNTFTGAEIGTGFDDYLRYGAGQLPIGRQVHGAIAGEGTEGQWARYLAGFPIRGVPERQQQGEFRRRQDIIDAVFNKEMNAATESEPTLGMLPEDDRRRLFRLMQGLNPGSR